MPLCLPTVQNLNIQNDMITSFQLLNVNFTQLSSQLGLSYTLSANDIDFINLSRSFVTNDDGQGEAIVAPFKTNSSSNTINYAFCITVDADSIYKPFIIKATTNQSLKYFDLDEGYILTVNNYTDKNTLSFQSTTGNYLNTSGTASKKLAACGQATMNCALLMYIQIMDGHQFWLLFKVFLFRQQEQR